MSDGAPALPAPDAEARAAHLDLALAAAEVGTFHWDMRADVLVLDDRLCGIFDLDPATFDGRISTFFEALLPEDVPAVQKAIDAAMDGCGEYSAEYRIRRRDGSVRWIDARGRVLPGTDGTAHRMLGVARDSTDSRLARDTVARALEHMADGFVSVDRTWRVTYANQHAEVFLGAVHEVVGRPLWDVWTHLTAGYRQVIEEAAATGEVRTFDKYVVARGAWYRVRAVPHPDGLSLFAVDVTAGKAAELERGRSLTRPDQARAVLAYSAALAQADSVADVIDVVANLVLPAFGASGVLVSLVDGNRLLLSGHAGYPPAAVEMLRLLRADDDTPIARTLRTREPLFLPSREAYLGLFRQRQRLVHATGKNAWAFLPLTVSGRALGTLTVSFDQPRDFAPDEQSLLVSVGGLLAQTLARARLRDSERSLAAELQQQLLPRALPRPGGLHGDGPLPRGHRRHGRRRRLVRRARAPRAAGHAGHRRRPGAHDACRGGHGTAAQRTARLRRRGARAGRGDVAHQPAGGRARPGCLRHLRAGRRRPADLDRGGRARRAPAAGPHVVVRRDRGAPVGGGAAARGGRG